MSKSGYEVLVDQLKTGHVYTNSGRFTPSDVLSMAMLNKVCEKENLELPEIHRTSDRVCFDQVGKNVVFGSRYNTLNLHDIYRRTGQELFGDLADVIGEKFVDRIDSGEETPIHEMLDGMNSNWNENYPQGLAFDNAIRIAEQCFDERIDYLSRGCDPDMMCDVICSLEEDISLQREYWKTTALDEAKDIIDGADTQDIDIDGQSYEILNLQDSKIPYSIVKDLTEDSNVIGYTVLDKNGEIAYKDMRGDDISFNYNEWAKSDIENEIPEEIPDAEMPEESEEYQENEDMMNGDNGEESYEDEEPEYDDDMEL